MDNENNKIKSMGDWIVPAAFAVVVLMIFTAMFNYSHGKHWDRKVPAKMNDLVYQEIPNARNLGFYHAEGWRENTINRRDSRYGLMDVFYKDNRLFLNVVLREAFLGPVVNELRMESAAVHIGNVAHALTVEQSGLIEDRRTLYSYFQFPRELMKSAVAAPDSYLVINTNKGRISADIAAKCPTYRDRHRHSFKKGENTEYLRHDHSDFDGHNNEHVTDYHTSAAIFSEWYVPKKVRNICAQLKAMLKYEHKISRGAGA